MSELLKRLDRVHQLLNDEDYLQGKGLSNEVNIRICCYKPEEEMIVRHFIKQIVSDSSLKGHPLEKNLYQIFLQICKDKRILDRIPQLEEKRGQEYVQKQLEKSIPVTSYIDYISQDITGDNDVVLLTGIGDVFPFMRVHKILEGMQTKMTNVPIIVLYPGEYNGRNLRLFNKLEPNNYYRAFNVLD